jgi:hypothetical protein
LVNKPNTKRLSNDSLFNALVIELHPNFFQRKSRCRVLKKKKKKRNPARGGMSKKASGRRPDESPPKKRFRREAAKKAPDRPSPCGAGRKIVKK